MRNFVMVLVMSNCDVRGAVSLEVKSPVGQLTYQEAARVRVKFDSSESSGTRVVAGGYVLMPPENDLNRTYPKNPTLVVDSKGHLTAAGGVLTGTYPSPTTTRALASGR